MIYLDSRYADGVITKAYNSVKKTFELTVYRVYPEDVSEVYYYEWIEGDRIDAVAAKLLGDSEYWWRIMDFNPELLNPSWILPGTMLRIPRAF
jgi:hypothetical protein